MSEHKRIVERVDAPFAGVRVDREKGIVFGVKLCGTTSANGRDYPPEMFRREIAKYDGVPINFNHDHDRRVENVGGRIKSPRIDADGTPRGDAHLLKSHPMYERVMEAAEKDPGLFGFSHVVFAKTSRGANGRERVEGYDRVEALDLVAQPATTAGLFESQGNGGRAVALTVKALCEALVKHPKVPSKHVAPLKALAEMDGAGDLSTTMDAAPPDDAGEGAMGDAIDEAFKTLMHAQLDALLDESHSLPEFLSNIRELYKTRAKVTGAGKNTDGATDTDDDPAATESKRLPKLKDIVAECKVASFPNPPLELVERLTTIGDPETRKFILGQLKVTESGRETPIAAGRDRTAPLAEGKRTEEAKAPASYWVD